MSVQLNSKSWHVRLMKFIWNFDHTDFGWLCPYFWLSVFNVMFFPVIMLVKLAIYWIHALDKTMEDNKLQRKENLKQIFEYQYFHLLELTSDEQIISFLKKYSRLYAWQLIDHIKWSYDNPDHDNPRTKFGYKVQALYEKYTNSVDGELRLVKIKQKETKKQKIARISRIVKPIGVTFVWLAIATAVIAALYGLSLLFTVKAAGFIALKIILMLLGLGLTIVLIFFVVNYFEEREKNLNPFPWIWKKISFPFILLGKVISDSCPAIDWKE